MIPRRPLLLILSELIRWVKALTRLGLRLPLEGVEVAVKSLWRLQRGADPPLWGVGVHGTSRFRANPCCPKDWQNW